MPFFSGYSNWRPRARPNESTTSNHDHPGRVLRSQTNTTERELQAAQTRIQELTRSKRDAEATITNLHGVLRRRNSDRRKLETKLQKTNATNNRLHNDNQQLREHHKELESKCKSTKDNCQFVVDKIVKPYQENLNHEVKGLTITAFKNILNRMLQDALQSRSLHQQNQALRSQVQELQNEMLEKVKKIRIVTDDQFAQELRSLASFIKSLSRTIVVDDRTDISRVFESLVLLSDVSPHYWKGRAQKKSLMEAWIWSILIHYIFRNPFAMFGNDTKLLNTAWMQMFGDEFHHGWPFPSPHCETWRYQTIERLIEVAGEDTIVRGIVEPMPEGLKDSVITNRVLVATAIQGHLDLHSPGPNNTSQIYQIVNKAFGLAAQMSLSRSRLQLTYPSTGARFNNNQMSGILHPDYEDDDDVMGHGVVAFVINPGLAKWGDAYGENFDQRYDIVPSLVQVEIADATSQPQAEGHPHETGYSDANGQLNGTYEGATLVKYDVEGEPYIKREPNIKQESE